VRRALVVSTLLLSAGVASSIPRHFASAQSDRGAQLAATCTACHRLDGHDQGIPAIAGMNEQSLARAMRAYKSGQRSNLIMRTVARSLSDEDIALVAHHFAALGKTNDSGKTDY
jgi:sulfide dehydrogenase cytochrome subunit